MKFFLQYALVLSLSIIKLNAQTITVVSPNGGEYLPAGNVDTIRWTGGGSNSVDIYLSIDSGISWTSVALVPASQGYYLWTVPNTPSQKCLIRLNIYPSVTIVSDKSDSVFTIVSTIGIDSFIRQQDFLDIYPNPATVSLFVELPYLSIPEYTVRFYDLLGNEIKLNCMINSNHIKVDITALEVGTYFVEVKTGEKRFLGKFIKPE